MDGLLWAIHLRTTLFNALVVRVKNKKTFGGRKILIFEPLLFLVPWWIFYFNDVMLNTLIIFQTMVLATQCSTLLHKH
jgi:hypothetical protein